MEYSALCHTEREPGPENANCEAFLENCARYSDNAQYQYMLYETLRRV